MFLIQFSEVNTEFLFRDVLNQIDIPITLHAKKKFFEKITIHLKPSEIILSSNKINTKLQLPLSIKSFYSSLVAILKDFKITFQNASFYPLSHSISYLNKKIVLGEIHNKILTQLILHSNDGIDKINLYEIIWQNDKVLQINKLDTHLTNLKNLLYDNLGFQIRISTNAGIVSLS